MKTYLSTIRLRFEESERYKAHQQIDTLIQEKIGARSAYSWRIAPFPNTPQHSLVQIRSAAKLQLPGEVEETYNFSAGDTVSFRCAFNSEIREIINGGKRKERIGSLEEVLAKLNSVAEKNGIAILAAEQIADAIYEIKKKGTQFILGHRYLSVIAQVNEPALFEIAISEGLGKKRMFGFGFIESAEVL